MPQDKISGAKANYRGHKVGRKVANLLNIELNLDSNEGLYKGLNSVIKCVGQNTKRFGINNAMLLRLSQVIVAKETRVSGKYELYLVAIEDIGTGTPSRSRGSEGRTTMFQLTSAINKGHNLCEIEIIDT